MTTNKIPLIWESNLIDINNDRGFSKIASIIERAPEDVKEELSSILQKYQQREITKQAEDINSNSYLFKSTAKLPIDSYDDIVLSKLYLEDQKSNIPTDLYKKADNTINSLAKIFDIPTNYFNWLEGLSKTASEYDVEKLITYLLPEEQLFPVYNKRDLLKVASIYTDNESKFLLNQKVEFSRNFVKKALELNHTNIPANISKYASALDVDFASVYQYLEKRADWIEVHCAEEAGTVERLRDLAQDILKIAELPEKEQAPYKEDVNSLNKLAYSINEIDKRVGIGSKQYKKKIFPDAFGTVFNKVAGEIIGRGITAADTDEVSNSSDTQKASILNDVEKATIVAAFGEDVLEDLEDDQGNLDQERAKKLMLQAGIVTKDKGI